MRVVPTDGPLDLSGHTLVVPGCGSLAHLGELCVDAVVSSFGLSRVAIVRSAHVLPMASASAWEAPGAQAGALRLTTAAELYQSGAAPKLSVLQLRSMIKEGRRDALARELWEWACEQGVTQLIIVSSCSSHVKVDADFAAGTDLRYVSLGAGAPPAPAGRPGPLPLGHALQEEEIEPGQSRDAAAVRRFLRSGGVARPLLLLALKGAEEGSAKDFAPPPRTAAGGKRPGVLCLLGLTSEALDLQLTEQLASTACGAIAEVVKLEPAPRLVAPPSWMFELETAMPDRRLWA